MRKGKVRARDEAKVVNDNMRWYLNSCSKSMTCACSSF